MCPLHGFFFSCKIKIRRVSQNDIQFNEKSFQKSEKFIGFVRDYLCGYENFFFFLLKEVMKMKFVIELRAKFVTI